MIRTDIRIFFPKLIASVSRYIRSVGSDGSDNARLAIRSFLVEQALVLGFILANNIPWLLCLFENKFLDPLDLFKVIAFQHYENCNHGVLAEVYKNWPVLIPDHIPDDVVENAYIGKIEDLNKRIFVSPGMMLLWTVLPTTATSRITSKMFNKFCQSALHDDQIIDDVFDMLQKCNEKQCENFLLDIEKDTFYFLTKFDDKFHKLKQIRDDKLKEIVRDFLFYSVPVIKHHLIKHY